MTIDRRYIPAFNLENVFLDKDTGEPLANGKISFFKDTDRTATGVKPVYQISGSPGSYTFTSLGTELTLSSIGTIVDSFGNPVVPYFYPFDANGDVDYYYVKVESAGSVLQFERESVPYIPDDFTNATTGINYANEISNPQFVEVLYNEYASSYTFNFSSPSLETIQIAPNWDIVITGTGACTVTLQRVAPVGSLNVPTNPPYLLNINSSGTITLLQLRQRLYGSPNIFGSQYVSSTFVAKTFSGNPDVLTLRYVPSDGTLDETLLSVTLNGTRTQYPTTTTTTPLIPASDSTESAPNAYVDLIFDIPVTTNIELTSVQVVATGANAINIPYDETTTNRQEDQLFHYYKPLLEQKPIPSILTAWDFPLNPVQINGATGNITTTAAYTWDQTICKSVVGNIAYARNAVTGGFQATTANNLEAFYMLQYLSGNQAKKILGTRLSCNINAYRTDAGGDVTARAYLYRGSSAATVPTLGTTIGTIAASGVFTLTAANWTLIARSGLGTPEGDLPVVAAASQSQLNDVTDLGFSGWEVVDDTEISDTDKFAIVVTFQCPTTGSVVVVNSISLVAGEIPTRPAPQTPDEVLRECEYYYEKSFESTTANSTTDAIESLQAVRPWYAAGPVLTYLRSAPFSLSYKVIKRTTPTLTFYNPHAGTSNAVYGEIWNDGALAGNLAIPNFSTNWTIQGSGVKGAYFIPTNNTDHVTSAVITPIGISSVIRYHYTADARLGIV